jgi:electron transport complex protein RnfB
MNPVLLASVIGLGGLGITFGAILAFAAKKLAVEVDPRIEQLEEILPGANCGACGYPGCAGYAEAVVTKDEKITLCSPGGQETVEKIARIMGKEAEEMIPMVAVVRCGGSVDKAKSKYIYEGIEDCNVANLLSGGSKACEYGCLGLGTCVKACPYDAMAMRDDGLPMVFEDKCTGCGICVEVCPKGIMELIPRTQKVYVACVSRDRGKDVKAVCSVGCTGCTLCANPKFTPSGKVKMDNNLPVVPPDWEDYETAVAKCPAKCFVVRDV